MIFPAVFLFTGLALLIAIPSRLDLSWILLLLCVFALSGGLLFWRRFPQFQKNKIIRRIKAGVMAGIAATAAYDLSRFLLVQVFSFHVQPFEAIPLFGQLLIGNDASYYIQLTVGILYHLVNGVGFAIAYSIWFAPRGWWCGVLWALVLEAAMLAVYPGWLNIKMMDEFAGVSVIGHLVYGSVLGGICKWRILKSN